MHARDDLQGRRGAYALQAGDAVAVSRGARSSPDRSVVCDIRGEQELGITQEESMPVAQRVRYSPEVYAKMQDEKRRKEEAIVAVDEVFPGA